MDKLRIPNVPFQNHQSKNFEFEIISNTAFLLENPPTDHDPFHPHRIQFYAILFIKGGKGRHFIDFKEYTYQQGSVIFISREQVHAFERNKDREAYFLLFTNQFLEQISMGSNLMQHISLYNYHLYHPVLQLKPREWRLFSELIARMKEEFDAPDDFATEELIQSSLKILLIMAERIRKRKVKTYAQSIYYDEFLILQKLLKEHLFENRQVQFYADKMNVSTKKLNRITQEIKKLSTKSYINETLTMETKRLLTNTALSVQEVAYRIGFEEPTNFVKFFKKNTDLTPLEFRKRLQGK